MTGFVVLFAVYTRNWTLLKVMLSVQAVRFLWRWRQAHVETMEKQWEDEIKWHINARRRETQRELLEAMQSFSESLRSK